MADTNRIGAGSDLSFLDIRYLASQSNPQLNVRDYGALGNGVNNDTSSINSAIVALTATIASTGQAELFFPQGTYMVDGITIASLSHKGRQ